MNRTTMQFRMLVLACAVAPLGAASASSHGNSFSTQGTSLREYTDAGVLVQTIPVPYPGSSTSGSEKPRDHVVDPNGDIYVYNGTFDPYLSIYRAGTGTWDHFTNANWSTSNNVSYGGIAVLGDYAFVTDNLTSDGIYRFDTTDGSSTVFGQNWGFIDLTIGRDGQLYGLTASEAYVVVFDVETLAIVNQFFLERGVRGIAVDVAGEIYGASWDGKVYHFAPDGSLSNTLDGGVGSLQDIDIDPCGNIYIASRFMDLLQTDASLSSISTSYFGGNFVSFAEPAKALAGGTEVVRAGSPPNSAVLLPGATGPVLGGTWTPSLQPYLPGAVFDVLVVARAPANFQGPFGTLLCAPESVLDVFVTPAGSPFQVPIPGGCQFNGTRLCTQAFSVAPKQVGALSNALDVTIGTF